MLLNKYLIPFHIFSIVLYSFIISSGFEKDKTESFRSEIFTLKESPKFNSTFTFHVHENNNKYLIDDYGLAVIDKTKALALKKNELIEVYIKNQKSKNAIEKLNTYLGYITVYGIETQTNTLLKLDDYIGYRKKDNNSFLGKAVYTFIFILNLYSIYWLICIFTCILNPNKIETFSKSKWCSKLVFRDSNDFV